MNDFQVANDAIAHQAAMAAGQVHACAADVTIAMMRPSVLYRPKVYPDGSMWCALYGDNLQEGVAGFGESPAAAMLAFDQAWVALMPVRRQAASETSVAPAPTVKGEKI